MSNMSYCQFENTAGDLSQCIATVGNAVDDDMSFQDFVDSLSSDHEVWAFDRLYRNCKAFVKAYEEMKEIEHV